LTLIDRKQFRMPTHVHPQSRSHGRAHGHHHAAEERHPPASIAPSILRMSAAERLAVVAVVIAALWGTVYWALT
jgi:hypothetical protein